MHKRNITIIALVLAAVITGAFAIPGYLNHSGALGLFYFPYVLLSVLVASITSNNGHSPSAGVGWSCFVVYTIMYWGIFLAVYALLLELYLLRQVCRLRHLDDAAQCLASEKPDSKMALGKIGEAIKELETRRRKHNVLLKKIDALDFLVAGAAAQGAPGEPGLPRPDAQAASQEPHRRAARAIVDTRSEPPVKRLLKKFRTKLEGRIGSQRAGACMAQLQKDADTFAP
jgi:hypothetical protein